LEVVAEERGYLDRPHQRKDESVSSTYEENAMIEEVRKGEKSRISTGAFFFVGIVFLWGVRVLLAQHDPPELRISGASTIQPVVQELRPLYQTRYGGSLRIRAGGSGAGIREVLDGAADIGMVSRALRQEEQAQLHYVTIGLDILVVIVNIRNPITAIDRALIGRIYSGEIRAWNEVADYDQPIQLVNKEIGRSTLDLFEEYSGLLHAGRSGGGRKISGKAFEIGSNLESLSLVGGLPGAIGYVSMGAAKQLMQLGMPVKILTLDGVTPSSSNAVSGRYPIRRELNLVFTRREPAVETLLELFRSSEAEAILTAQGFLPVHH
jgi:phosphate transport system substrate-binding protein